MRGRECSRIGCQPERPGEERARVIGQGNRADGVGRQARDEGRSNPPPDGSQDHGPGLRRRLRRVRFRVCLSGRQPIRDDGIEMEGFNSGAALLPRSPSGCKDGERALVKGLHLR